MSEKNEYIHIYIRFSIMYVQCTLYIVNIMMYALLLNVFKINFATAQLCAGIKQKTIFELYFCQSMKMVLCPYD